MINILESFEIGWKVAIKVLQWTIISENETTESYFLKTHKKFQQKKMQDIKKIPVEFSELKMKVTKK